MMVNIYILFTEDFDSDTSMEQGRGPLLVQLAGIRLQETCPESHQREVVLYQPVSSSTADSLYELHR